MTPDSIINVHWCSAGIYGVLILAKLSISSKYSGIWIFERSYALQYFSIFSVSKPAMLGFCVTNLAKDFVIDVIQVLKRKDIVNQVEYFK